MERVSEQVGAFLEPDDDLRLRVETSPHRVVRDDPVGAGDERLSDRSRRGGPHGATQDVGAGDVAFCAGLKIDARDEQGCEGEHERT